MGQLATSFTEGTSFIHDTAPRYRLLAAAGFTIPVALIRTTEPAMIALILALLTVLFAKLPARKLISRLIPVNIFTAFLWPFLPFSTPGEALFTVGPLTATMEGVQLATLLTIKANAIFLAFAALVSTIPVQWLGPAMQDLRIPDKLCHLLMFTHRYTVLIHQELQGMVQAAKARGFRPGTNMHTYRTMAWIAAMLLVRSWDRAERVRDAMHCRGFKNRFHCLHEFTAQTGDRIFAAAYLMAGVAVIAADIYMRKGA